MTRTLVERLWQATLWPGAAHDGLPGTPGAVEGGIARTGPRTWTGWEAEPPALDPERGAVADLGHARVRFSIPGEAGREAMRRLVPLDLRDRAFPEGRLKATTAHHVGVWVHRDAEGWHLWAPTTFADSMAELLEETLEGV